MAFVGVNALFTAIGLDLSVSFPVPVKTVTATNCDSGDDNASK